MSDIKSMQLSLTKKRLKICLTWDIVILLDIVLTQKSQFQFIKSWMSPQLIQCKSRETNYSLRLLCLLCSQLLSQNSRSTQHSTQEDVSDVYFPSGTALKTPWLIIQISSDVQKAAYLFIHILPPVLPSQMLWRRWNKTVRLSQGP